MYVSIAPGCIACNVCSSICPTVFTVTDTCHADNTQVPGNEALCHQAAQACPVLVINIAD
jgi:ferredoxin